MKNEVVIVVKDIVPSHFVSSWLQRCGSQLGRFDSKDGYQARHDAAESAFTQKALTFIEMFMYDTLIPPLEARTFVPTAVKAHPGADSYLYRRITRTGMARLISDAAMDLPRASMYVDEVNQRFYPIDVKIEYSYFELLAVGMAVANGQPVDIVGESLRAALEAIEKKLDIIAAFGTATPPTGFSIEVDADPGLTGLLNNTNATAYTIPVGASGFKAWNKKTADEILADLNGIVGGQVATTYKVHRPDQLIVPISQFETQLQRRMSDVSGETVLSFFLRTRREAGHKIEVASWMYAAAAPAGPLDVILAYKRDPRMFEHVLAMDATPLPATTVGVLTTQPVVAKTAGIIMRYPLSVSIGSGI